jgi:hypothetical protein
MEPGHGVTTTVHPAFNSDFKPSRLNCASGGMRVGFGGSRASVTHDVRPHCPRAFLPTRWLPLCFAVHRSFFFGCATSLPYIVACIAVDHSHNWQKLAKIWFNRAYWPPLKKQISEHNKAPLESKNLSKTQTRLDRQPRNVTREQYNFGHRMGGLTPFTRSAKKS